MSRLDSKLADDLKALTGSRIWMVIKYRLKEYTEVLDKGVHAAVRVGDVQKSTRMDGMTEGVTEAISIIENLGGELQGGKLDVDAALGNELTKENSYG